MSLTKVEGNPQVVSFQAETTNPEEFAKKAPGISRMVLELLKDCQKLCFQLQKNEADENRLSRKQLEEANGLKSRCTQIQAVFTLAGAAVLAPVSKEIKEALPKIGDCLSYLTKAEGDKAEAAGRKSELKSSTTLESERAFKNTLEKLMNLVQSLLQQK
jgi:hypothetical protein